MYLLGSEEWLKALAEAINNSPAYAKAAKTWEGDFYFIIDPGGALSCIWTCGTASAAALTRLLIARRRAQLS